MQLDIELDHVHGDVPHPTVLVGDDRIDAACWLRRFAASRGIAHARQAGRDQLVDTVVIAGFLRNIEGFEALQISVWRLGRFQCRASREQQSDTRKAGTEHPFHNDFPVFLMVGVEWITVTWYAGAPIPCNSAP